MWSSITDMVQTASGATYPDTPTNTINKKEEEGAPPTEAAPVDPAEGTTENVGAAPQSGGLWGSLTQIAGGIQTAVEEQIKIQSAEMEKEQVYEHQLSQSMYLP